MSVERAPEFSYAPMVSAIIEKMGVTHVLDYGCGPDCTLARNLDLKHKLTYQAYDPQVKRFARPPMAAQMVCCIDMLDHLEPDSIDTTLDQITSLCEGIVFLALTGPLSEWLPKLWDRFDLQTVQVTGEGFCVIGTAKPRIEATDGTQLV